MYREKSGFVQSLEFWKNSWNVPSNFPDLEKVLGFFFWRLQQVLYKWNFFCFVKSYSILPVHLQHIMKKALLLHFLRSLLIAYKYLITVSLENETIVLEKVWKKSWFFYPKICTNPESTSPLKHSNLYLCPCYRIYWWLNVNKNWYSCWTTTVACASI